MLEDAQGVCGYAFGAFDSRRSMRATSRSGGRRSAPGTRCHKATRPRGRARRPCTRGYHHPTTIAEPYEAYPSHLHIDLLSGRKTRLRTAHDGRGDGQAAADAGRPGCIGCERAQRIGAGVLPEARFREMIGSARAATASSTWERHSAHDLRSGAAWGRPVRTRPSRRGRVRQD